MAIKPDENYYFCKNLTEDLTHVFLSCRIVINIWIRVENRIKVLNVHIDH